MRRYFTEAAQSVRHAIIKLRHMAERCLAGGENVRYRSHLIFSSLAINILSLALPIMTLQVYDRILAYENVGTLRVLIVGVSIVILMEMTLRIARSYVTGWAGAKYEHKSSCEAMHHLVYADVKYSSARDSGEYMQDFNAIGKMREFYSGQALTALIDLPFILVFLGLIGYLAGWLVMVPIILLMLFAILAWDSGSRLKMALHAREQSDDKRYGFMIEVLKGIHSVKSLALEAPIQRRYEALQSGAGRLNYRAAELSGLTTTMGTIFGQVMMIGVITAGAPMVVEGSLSTGTMIACLLLSGRIMQPVQRALTLWTRYQDFRLAQQRSEALFTLPTIQQAHVLQEGENEGRLECVNLSFGYDDDSPMALHDINLKLHEGEVVALRGDHSSGKTTLLKLIAGLYAPSRGHVRVNGMDAHRYTSEQLLRQVGYMPSEGVIYRGSILDNLTGFNAERRSKAHEIARLLGIDAAVSRLPLGYETLLEGGAADAIPPGLKQRLAIGRVLAEKPRILLFDNADRALDREGYNHVFRLLGRLKGRVTMVLASDDRNILQMASATYELRHGQLLRNDSYREAHDYALKEQREVRI